MRDIEFRGKLKVDNGSLHKNDWVYGDYVKIKDGDEGIKHFIYYFGEIYKNTLGQYTGVGDNSEQKVYEGDILQDPNNFDDGLYVVEFMDGEFVLVNDNIIYDIEQVHFLQIIGNIHDDKDLLTDGGNEK